MTTVLVFARHLASVAASVFRFGVSTRKVTLLLLVVAGLALLLLAAGASAAAPFVLYPFI